MSTHKAWFARLREKRRRDGLCAECGKRPSVRYRCVICRANESRRYRSRKVAA